MPRLSPALIPAFLCGQLHSPRPRDKKYGLQKIPTLTSTAFAPREGLTHTVSDAKLSALQRAPAGPAGVGFSPGQLASREGRTLRARGSLTRPRR